MYIIMFIHIHYASFDLNIITYYFAGRGIDTYRLYRLYSIVIKYSRYAYVTITYVMVFGLHQSGRIYFSESTFLRDQTDQTIKDTANEYNY